MDNLKHTQIVKPIMPAKKRRIKRGKSIKDLYAESVSFSKFDPITGEKVATEKDTATARRMAAMERETDARQSRTSPVSLPETMKDAATGGSLSFLTASTMIKSPKIKAGLGLAGTIGAGLASAKNQLSSYNRQMGARESILGKNTERGKEYSRQLKKKYNP